MKLRAAANSYTLAGLALALALPLSLHAQHWRLYVDNSNGEDVSVIDLHSLKLVDDISIGASLIHGLA